MIFLRPYLISVLILCLAQVVLADSAPDVPVKDSIYVNIGGTTPLSPSSFTMKQTSGYNVGIGYGFGLSKLFQLVIDVNADNFPSNISNIIGGDMRVGTLLANIRFRVLAEDNPVVPYLIGGIGGAYVTESAFSYSGLVFPATSSTNLALRLGFGIDIRLSQLTSLFVDLSSYGIAAITALKISTTVHCGSAVDLIFKIRTQTF